jgi:uncharacterized protein (DUF952 family)
VKQGAHHLNGLSLSNKEKIMGMKLTINSILKTQKKYDLKVGQIYCFNKKGSRLYFDNIPIWLTDENWTALADISIISQSKQNGSTFGTFRVDYIYQGEEQKVITNMLIRLYAGLSDKYIYLIVSEDEYQRALKTGEFKRDTLDTEGFIHASPKSQLNRVANKFYKKCKAPLILLLDKEKITSKVTWEPAKGGLYPHIYGPVNTDCFVKKLTIELQSSGLFEIDVENL